MTNNDRYDRSNEGKEVQKVTVTRVAGTGPEASRIEVEEVLYFGVMPGGRAARVYCSVRGVRTPVNETMTPAHARALLHRIRNYGMIGVDPEAVSEAVRVLDELM